MSKQQAALAQQQAEQQAQMAAQSPGGGEIGYSEGGRPPEGNEETALEDDNRSELETKIDDATSSEGELTKSDISATPHKSLRQHQDRLLRELMEDFEKESKKANEEILEVYRKFEPERK